MAPIKSSLAKTVSKLLGVQKDTDLSLRGATQSTRVPPQTPFSATGGSKITVGDYTYHVWLTTTPAPLSVFNVTQGTRSLDVLLVGGGGGGGANNSGGGGGGGMVYGTEVITATDGMTNVPITIGGGGSGGAGPPNEQPGALGGDTIFGSSPNPYYLIAKAGGASGQWTQGNATAPGGGSGGSGAGGPGNPTSSPNVYPSGITGTQGSQPGNSGTYGFGGTGGDGVYTGTDGGGGGGGGAGGNGGDSPAPSGSSPGGTGGAGKATIFSAPILAPAIPSPNRTAWTNAVGPTGLYGGGGGGGAGGPSPASGGAGGPGGGGAGGAANSSTAGTPGVFGTGGGGGGGDNTAGGDGCRGIMVFRYLS